MNNALENLELTAVGTGSTSNEARAVADSAPLAATNEAGGAPEGESAEEPFSEPVVTIEELEPEQDGRNVHGREVADELELSALTWRRFAGIGPNEIVELVAIGPGGIRVAYAKGESQYLKLLREGERLAGVTGLYQVANQLTSRVRQMCQLGNWVKTNRRGSDLWVSDRRLLPIDIDSVRASGQSATDAEKAPCYEAADKIEDVLRQHVDPWALGRGDSGNGLWLFIALQQVRRSDADDEQIAKLLKDLQSTFGSKHCKIDTTVANASRLVPAFGTEKRKGKPSKERPWRRTTFSCFGEVRRVRLAELF